MAFPDGPGCNCTVYYTVDMISATPLHHALARQLLCAELGDSNGGRELPATAERVLEKLSQRLVQLITPVGSEALLARAVHLSRAPFLAAAQTTRSCEALTQRLRECAASVEPSEARDGFVVLLGTLITLLISFIGKNLTFRVLRDVWPELPIVQPIPKNGTSNVEMTP